MAFALNGSSQYLISSAALTAQTNFSVFLRFKANSFTGSPYVFCAADTTVGAQNYIQILNSTEMWVGSYQAGVGGSVAALTGLSLNTGVWYDILGVWGATNQRIIYNGTTRVTDTTTITTTSTNRTTFGVGYYQGGAANHFNGSIADMAIWSTGLITPAQIDLTEVGQMFLGFSPQVVRPAAQTDYWPVYLPAGAANGQRGNVLAATNSNTLDTANPRVFF